MVAVINGSTVRPSALRRIYLPVAVVTLIVSIVGFWASYYGRLLAGNATTPAVIQVHAAVFIGWISLLIAQAWLAATNRLALHIKFGRYAMIYGALLVTMGIVATFAAFGTHLRNGNLQRAETILFVGLTDMLAFAPFLAAAWWYRARPELHKRLIVVATTMLLVAPAHRMHWFLGGPPAPAAYVLLIWLAPIYLAMAHDFITRRIVHPVYLIGVVTVIYMKFWRMEVYRSEMWREIADWLKSIYA